MKIQSILIIPLFFIIGTNQLAAETVDTNILEARELVQKFFGSLKNELQSALQEGGPITAISICKLKAPRITKEFSSLSGWYVARTSLKLRNPFNAGDDWENKVLAQFESRKAGGEELNEMEYSEEIMIKDKKIFRYMKAIEVMDLCLNCHGENVKPGISRILKQLYPNDQAIGFKIGDLRGAFTLAKSLSNVDQ
ncbi:MAG: DUF3365 domain-containing protein [Gammaproteobacteria bacterium]|nr:DUF3365 domain-containing protein [Gammaproteobacteria bacterium]